MKKIKVFGNDLRMTIFAYDVHIEEHYIKAVNEKGSIIGKVPLIKIDAVKAGVTNSYCDVIHRGESDLFIFTSRIWFDTEIECRAFYEEVVEGVERVLLM